jgi:uncharacterized membrane protein YheB (UPF0754 family)
MNYWLFITPIIGALAGWLIHSLAISIVIRRILPRKKQQLANNIGKLAAKEFASFQGLEEKINDPKNLESILPFIENHIDTFLNEKLKKEMPVISMFIGSKTTDKLKEVFMKEIESLFPQVISQFAGNLKSSLDIEGIVRRKIEAISPDELDQLITRNLSAELNWIRLLGAVTGLITGILLVLVAVLNDNM